MLCSRQPPFVSFLHVGISVLFQVTHLALWGTDLLLVRQAPEDDKVHLQLKDMGMGWRWAWWMHIECSWLSRPHCDIQPPRTSQFPSQISEGELSHIPLQGKARQKKKNAQAVILHWRLFQENSSREGITHYIRYFVHLFSSCSDLLASDGHTGIHQSLLFEPVLKSFFF